jgi:hypothetical protein
MSPNEPKFFNKIELENIFKKGIYTFKIPVIMYMLCAINETEMSGSQGQGSNHSMQF